MAHIKIPFNVPHAVQATIAVLSAVAAIGTEALHSSSGLLPQSWVAPLAAFFTLLAAVAGFLKKAEPAIDDIANEI